MLSGRASRVHISRVRLQDLKGGTSETRSSRPAVFRHSALARSVDRLHRTSHRRPLGSFRWWSTLVGPGRLHLQPSESPIALRPCPPGGAEAISSVPHPQTALGLG